MLKLCLGLVVLIGSKAGSVGAPPSVQPANDAVIRSVIGAVARHQLRPLLDGDYRPVASAADLAQRAQPRGLAWSYPWGVTLYGVTRAGEALADAGLVRFPAEHARLAARYFSFLDASRSKLGASTLAQCHTPLDQLMALGSLDSCGAMGTAVLETVLHDRIHETSEEKRLLARIADWIVNRQDRLPDGTLWRASSNGRADPWKPGTVWLDDLYMACPFLVRWSAYTGEASYREDAVHQILNMAALLQDADGVWYHAYFVNEHRCSPIKWGRANGWGMVATVEVLSSLPPDDTARPALLRILRSQIDGVERLQAGSGLWHQVLDHPETWEETSCSAMFAYSIARAVNQGWIDRTHLRVARMAFAGVATQVTPEGVVNGTCEGTNIGLDVAFYANRRRPSDDLHGRGVVELAGAEILAAHGR
jgi:unsaturated rhamnogalacturonyl hydrolase